MIFKVLVIAPHMDDEVLGCGGTIRRHVTAGDDVIVCIVTQRAYNHEYDHELISREKDACHRARDILGYNEIVFLDLPDEKLDQSQIDIIVPLEETVNEYRPDIVYLPHRGDNNQDHRAVFEAVRVACRPYAAGGASTLRVYEVPSSTDIVPLYAEWPFLSNYYVDISAVLEDKLKAMACYEAESRPFPHPRSQKGLRTYAMKRGIESGLSAAEAFMVIRDFWDKK
jgi:LmbE family N-acetylglucosaminyl deacetylase